MKHCISGIFFGLTISALPFLCGGTTNDFENALIEMEEQAVSNVLAAVSTGDVEPLRMATWAFGKFLTKYGKTRRETWDAVTLTRMNKLRLMFAQAAFSMRDRCFDAETERERLRDTSMPSQDHAKWKAVFNREAQLEMIHKGFVMEARHHGGVAEGVSGDRVQAFERLVDETVKDEELKGELLALSTKQTASSEHIEPFCSIRLDDTNVVFKIWSKPNRYILRKTDRETWLSSPGEEISVPLGSGLSVIIRNTVLTVKPLPDKFSHAGFQIQKVVNPRSASDYAHPEQETILLLKRCLKNPAIFPPDTPLLTGLILTNIPIHAASELLRSP
jgi:hypothetical protein